MFAVHFLSHHSIAPREEQLNAMKHMYHYLSGTQDLRLCFHGDQFNQDLIGFSDLDWAGNLNSWRLVTRYAFIFCGAVIAWSAKKQPTIALSSTEAEDMAMTH